MCIQNAYNFIRADKETKEYIKDILVSMSNNKKFCEDAGKLADGKDGINDTVANKIVKLSFVQGEIDKKIEMNKFIKKADLERGIKDVIVKAWNNKTIIAPAINQVKNDIK